MRLLPMLLATMGLTMVAKMYDVTVEGKQVARSWLIADSQAVTEEAPAAPPAAEVDAAAAKEKPKDKKDDESPVSTTAPETTAPRTVYDEPLATQDSQIEKDLLQSLSKRRQELEEAEKALALKESILQATEMRIDSKIAELRELKKTVEISLGENKKKDEQQILSLVKIYENMKPKEAARIFEEIDMAVLLQVVGHMDEKKIAPILANMNPTRAKEVTVEIAKKEKLPEPEALTDVETPGGPPAALPKP